MTHPAVNASPAGSGAVAVADLPAVPVEHPEWCAGDCHTTVAVDGLREMVHDVDVFDAELRSPRNVIDEETFPSAWPGTGSRTATVALVRIDYWGPDGVLQSDGQTDVVLDGPEGVVSLTPAEAARLGAALIRAARQARPDLHVACLEHGGAHCEGCDRACPCPYAGDARSR